MISVTVGNQDVLRLHRITGGRLHHGSDFWMVSMASAHIPSAKQYEPSGLRPRLGRLLPAWR
jgi:hypothetical protein